MRVLVVTMGIAPESGGPTRSVKGLCRALAAQGADITLLVLHGNHEFDDPGGVKVVRGLSHLTDVNGFDIVHLQGLWDPLLHQIAKMCIKVGTPYVFSPRGMLDPWALSIKKWKKRLAMFLYQRGDLVRAAAFHATAELEASNIRAQGLKQPIFIVPNGVEVPEDDVARNQVEVKGRGRQRTAIFLSRLHPGKGLLILAEAWAMVKPRGWVMRVIGPDSYGHKAEVLAKLDALGISHTDVSACVQSSNSSWQFVDMVDDKIKWLEYAAAEMLVHPSVSENFGITIAEGLYAGLPVICTDGTPWTDVVERKCGWYIKANSVSALTEALREATTSDELVEMGRRGRKFIEERYTWRTIGNRMIRSYQEVLNGRA